MGVYSEALGRFLNRSDLTIKATGAEAPGASGGTTTGSWVELGDAGVMNLLVNITVAATGTSPTMLVTIEGSDDTVTAYTLGQFGANGYTLGTPATVPTNFVSATYAIHGSIPAARYVRYKAVIGGTSTPTFTYSIAGSSAG